MQQPAGQTTSPATNNCCKTDWHQIIDRQRDVLPQILKKEPNAGEISERRDGGTGSGLVGYPHVWCSVAGHHTGFPTKNNNFLKLPE
jgi:hypothetical protein